MSVERDPTATRRAGLLLHPTALPGRGGIGTLGSAARDFLDLLADCDLSLWQVCPLGPTTRAAGNSPYQSPSAYAGSPLLIDLERVADRGWLAADETTPGDPFPTDHVDYDRVVAFKEDRLRTAFETFRAEASEDDRDAFAAFREREDWLADYTLFAACKAHFDGDPWTEWPEPLRLREPDALAEYRERLADAIDYRAFRQWLFDRQWRDLKAAANERGIAVVGDLPIYPALDSADVWASPDSFQLDDANRPTAVAGVPGHGPDPAQRWGNPLYDWDALAEDGYEWWLERFERLFDLVDVTRIDHFIALDRYYAIAADAAPEDGAWREGPGQEFLATVADHFGELPVLAEDLGVVTDSVTALRREFGVPGMKVLQYANYCEQDHMYMPHTFPEDSVAYASTHDTNTARGWYEGLDDGQRECVHGYFETDGSDVHWHLVGGAYGSDAAMALATPQDVLDLGREARFNTPGTAEGNWTWRLTDEQLRTFPRAELRELVHNTDRA